MTSNALIAPVDGSAGEPEIQSPPTITEQEIGEFREQDRVLPIANIARIMKNSVPTTSKISKEAKEAVQECLSEFISFITSEAAEKCHDEKRKTIGGEDVLYAMMLLGLEQYVEPLKIHLAKMRMHARSLTGKDCHSLLSPLYYQPTNPSANGLDADIQIEDEQVETPFA